RIPSNLIVDARHTMIGIGVVLSATSVTCASSPDVESPLFGDYLSPGKSYDVLNTYQTLSTAALNCESAYIVRAYSRPESIRRGFSGGSLVIGTPSAVHFVKRLSEFYNRDLRLVITLLVLFASV